MALTEQERNIRILVVDDYQLTRQMVKSILKQIGFTDVTLAEDGIKAIEHIRQGEVDFVICDWNMPEFSGLDVLKHVRGHDNSKHLPFLMLTAEAYRENVVEAMSAGVSDYIAKPFTSQLLADKIISILRPER